MTFTHALSTNNYGPAKFIVDPNAANGTHTTIASALTSASSGDTIFIRPGTYTENITLKAGVNITAFECDSSFNGTGKVVISGTCTLTTAGTVTISGIQLQTNSAALLAVTGSAASIVNLNNCYLNCTNNTGITFSSSSSSAKIECKNCLGDIGTTGITLITHTSAGTFGFTYSAFSNSGGSSTASTVSAGSINGRFSTISVPLSASGTGSIGGSYVSYQTESTNTTSITLSGASTTGRYDNCRFISGSAVAVSITGSATMNNCIIETSNANATSGSGSLIYGSLTFDDTGNNLGNTTVTAQTFRPGIAISAQQPAILVTLGSNVTNATGDGTSYVVAYDTEIFDQGGNFAANTFTAPVTGRYQISATFAMAALAAGHTSGTMSLVTSNRSTSSNVNPIAMANGTNLRLSNSLLMDMDAADTLTVTIAISGSTKTVTIGTPNFLSAILSC